LRYPIGAVDAESSPNATREILLIKRQFQEPHPGMAEGDRSNSFMRWHLHSVIGHIDLGAG
jgi:hypothetical protein